MLTSFANSLEKAKLQSLFENSQPPTLVPKAEPRPKTVFQKERNSLEDANKAAAENQRFQRDILRAQSISESKSVKEQNAHLCQVERDLRKSQQKEYKQILDSQIENQQRWPGASRNGGTAFMSAEEQNFNRSALKLISGQLETAEPMDLKPTPLQTIVVRETNQTPKRIIKAKLSLTSESVPMVNHHLTNVDQLKPHR